MHFRLVPVHVRQVIRHVSLKFAPLRRQSYACSEDKGRKHYKTAFSHAELRDTSVTPAAVLRVAERLKTIRSSLAFVAGQHEEDFSVEDFQQWSAVVLAPNVEDALRLSAAKLPKLLPVTIESAATSEEDSVANDSDTRTVDSSPSLPTWVVLYLLATKVYSPDQANLALALAFRHFPFTDPEIHPSLLILVARALAKHQTTPPLSPLLNTFLELPMSRQSIHFNLLLRAISHFHPSVEMAKITVTILDAMKSRQILLHDRTYRSLLNNRLVTLELTKTLQARMIHEGFIPHVEHLESFLRIFGKHGVIHDAGRYLDAIRFLKLKRGEVAPYGTELAEPSVPGSDGPGTITRWNTEYLRAFVYRRASAFGYLEGLVAADDKHSALEHPIRPFPVPRTSSPRPLLPGKAPLNVYNWNTALYIASRDKRISTEGLLRMFDRTKALTRTPNVSSYTAVFRGLLKREEYSVALAVWREFKQRKGRVDKKALTLGLDILTSAGHALEAFMTLEEHIASSRLLKPRSERERARYMIPDIIIMNSFMTALTRSGRPDIVFRIWDCLETVYGVKPNVVTVIVLLRAARAAKIFDNSLHAVWAHLETHNPFRGHNPNSQPMSREAQVSSLKELFGPESTRAKSTSLWGDVPAGRRAREIFRQVVLGNWPHLHEITSPAIAVRSDAAETHGPVRDFVRSIIRTRSPPDLISETGLLPLGPYPQIVPDAKAFHAYIELLGSLAFASEIPLALAWMRALNITPAQQTLSLALVLWGEVSIRGPLLEDWPRWSEYDRLVRWIRDWVGDAAVPTEKHIDRMFRIIKKQRERK